ncbi:lipase, partial [Enterobacter hormaechei]
SVGWNFPVAGHFTTGPVMAWRTDGAPSAPVNAFEDTTTTQSLTDPLWHASVNSLGWRVDTQYGDLHPWAKISYNQQAEEEYLYTLGLSAKF